MRRQANLPPRTAKGVRFRFGRNETRPLFSALVGETLLLVLLAVAWSRGTFF